MASNFAIQIAQNYDPSAVKYMPVLAAQTFITGALVVLSSGTIAECGADPGSITGIAMAPASVGLAATGSIYGGTNIPVYVLQPDTVCFMASATTPVFGTHVGGGGPGYSVEKTTNWRVDISDTGNIRVHIVDVSNLPLQEGFFVKFNATQLQLDAILS